MPLVNNQDAPIIQPNPATGNENGPPATVTYGTVTQDDAQGQFTSLGTNSDIFVDYMIVNRYERDQHVYMGGVTAPFAFQGSPGGTVSFVRLAAPTLLWIADWTASKWGAQPEVPDPTQIDPNWVFMDCNFELTMLNINPNGTTALYRVSGYYVYGHRNPSALILPNLAFPRPPWLQDVFNRTMPLAKLQQFLINTGTGVLPGGVPAGPVGVVAGGIGGAF